VVPRPRDPHVDLRSAIRAQHVEAALDLGEPNAASAVAKYYEIAAHKSGEEASQAFYSIAVLRHLRLARNADALQTLDAYVRRFPGGKQYRAVLWLRVRILCLDKLDDRCRAAAYTYLHEAPDGPAARVAELLTLSE
jgi:outer membrane protein assembly factor BamD (BamD/ComL family)